MCCTSDNHNYMCHTCAKEVFKFKLQLSSYWQNIKFSRYCPKFHIFTNIVIFQVFLQLLRPTASSLQISWQGHVRNTLFHFCQLPPVNVKNSALKSFPRSVVLHYCFDVTECPVLCLALDLIKHTILECSVWLQNVVPSMWLKSKTA